MARKPLQPFSLYRSLILNTVVVDGLDSTWEKWTQSIPASCIFRMIPGASSLPTWRPVTTMTLDTPFSFSIPGIFAVLPSPVTGMGFLQWRNLPPHIDAELESPVPGFL